MKDHYRNACELILRFKDHKEPLIRRTVITLIPAMGTYDQQAFQELFLHRSMAHLQHQLSKPGERDAAFLAIGHLAVNLGSEMKPFIERIITNVKESLALRGYGQSPTPSVDNANLLVLFTAKRMLPTKSPSSNV